MKEYKGACGCGEVTYSISSDPVNIINCHCNMCKSYNGSAFSTYAIFPIDFFKISTGSELLSKYVANDGEKNFCHKCGTPLFNAHNKYPGVCMVYLGTLNSTVDLLPGMNTWVENRLTWIDSLSEMKSLPQG